MIEIRNRVLHAGSLVLYVLGKGDISKANLGVVISKTNVFTFEKNLKEGCTKSPKYVYLIENPDEKEKEVTRKLLISYNNLNSLKNKSKYNNGRVYYYISQNDKKNYIYLGTFYISRTINNNKQDLGIHHVYFPVSDLQLQYLVERKLNFIEEFRDIYKSRFMGEDKSQIPTLFITRELLNMESSDIIIPAARFKKGTKIESGFGDRDNADIYYFELKKV